MGFVSPGIYAGPIVFLVIRQTDLNQGTGTRFVILLLIPSAKKSNIGRLCATEECLCLLR